MEREQADPFGAAAEYLAAQRGITAREFVEDATRRLDAYDYPTPSCLNPEDIVAYNATRTLLEQQRLHVATCHFCKELVTLEPSPGKIARFRELASTGEVKQTSRSPRRFPRAPQVQFGWGLSAATVGVFLCILLGAWSLLAPSEDSEAKSVVFAKAASIFPSLGAPANQNVQVITLRALSNPDVLQIKNRPMLSSVDLLRFYVSGRAAQAYIDSVSTDSETSRETKFRVTLMHELAHISLGQQDSRPLIQYGRVSANIDTARLFDKLDERRSDVLKAVQ